jgi:arylsulfatase
MDKPNILFIMTDQQRWDTLGAYGNAVIETANLDWLASTGTVFEYAYTPSPSCIPTRACLLTGMDPWNTGILGTGGGQGKMGVGYKHTLPGELANAGYHTHGVGVFGFFPRRILNGFHSTVLGGSEVERDSQTGYISDYMQWFDKNKTGDYGITDHGIDCNSWMSRPYHAPEFLHPSNWTVNESLQFLQRRDPTKPFFLKTSFARPHSPYVPPQYYFDLYEDKKQLPKASVGDWAHIHDVPADAYEPNAWRGVRTDEEIRRARAGYYGSIHHIDHQIGRLFRSLREQGLLDETLIIFTSDHGDMMGDHHLWRKTYAYEGSAHVPLLIKLPKSWGKVVPRVSLPVVHQDIMPTILDALNLNIPATVDGSSLLPLMRGDSCEWREFVHGEHSTCYSEEQEMQYLTDGRMKYIWFPRLGTEQLFNLEVDPYECMNLAEQADCKDELLQWRRRLTAKLAPRDAGLTDGEDLVCQAGKPYLVSPKYKERVQ